MVRLRQLPPIFISVCLLTVTGGTGGGLHTAWGAQSTQSAPPQSWQLPSSPEDPIIQYDSLPDLVKAYSPQVQMERTQYDSRVGRYETAKDDIMETKRHLQDEADDMEKNGDQQGAGNYRKQAKVLEKTAQSMDKQIKSLKGSRSTMSLRRMEDTTTWTAQNLMGTYNSLKADTDSAAAQSELMEREYQKSVNQTGLGMATQAQTEAAGKSAAAAANKAQSIKNEMEGIRQELLMLTGYPSDSQAQIGPMPDPDPGRVDKINLDTDKWRAMGNSYDLRQQRGSGAAGTNKEHDTQQRAIEQSEAGLYAQMDTLYQNVLAARTAWQSACTAWEAREAQWKAASHKKDLGMLSDQDYLKAKAAYLQGKADKAQADVNFQQAMDTYDWAVKGLTKG